MTSLSHGVHSSTLLHPLLIKAGLNLLKFAEVVNCHSPKWLIRFFTHPFFIPKKCEGDESMSETKTEAKPIRIFFSASVSK